MEFEWDDAKSDACFADRGFDFAYVAHAFLDEDRIVGVDRGAGTTARTATGCWAR